MSLVPDIVLSAYLRATSRSATFHLALEGSQDGAPFGLACVWRPSRKVDAHNVCLRTLEQDGWKGHSGNPSAKTL